MEDECKTRTVSVPEAGAALGLSRGTSYEAEKLRRSTIGIER